jgi:hypothetical protein
VRYLLLLANDAEDVRAWQRLTPEEAQKARAEEVPRWNQLFQWLGEQGLQTEGLELDGPNETRVVKVRGGRTLVSDGPYAETKESIGGFFVVKADDLDQAIEVAQRIPLVETGSVEIRPLAE